MKVTILTYTKDPADAISFAAGVCYGKRDSSPRRIKTCWERGHMSVFEQASVQFLIEGISRSCSHQLVRHRLNSYCQHSQRYVKMKVEQMVEEGWFIIPQTVKDVDMEREYKKRVVDDLLFYLKLIDLGVPAEDARYKLPECVCTNVVVTMNFRSIFSFLDMRLDPDAQWEIRELAKEMLEKCMMNPELRGITQLYVEKNEIKFE